MSTPLLHYLTALCSAAWSVSFAAIVDDGLLVSTEFQLWRMFTK